MTDAHERGAYDALHERLRAEALARDEEVGAKKAEQRRRAREAARRQDDERKRKKEEGAGLARDETELKEWILMLRERLGDGATEVVLVEDDCDKYGGLLETKGYKADVAELAKLEAKRGKTPEDEKAFTRKKNAMEKKRSRAFQRVEAEKAEGRVEALAGQVEKLLEEECYLGELLSMT